MQNLIDFSGRQIIIIGASSGIGKQTALTLSSLGARLILVARREDKLREVVTMLEGDGHGFYVADISRLEHIEEVFTSIKNEYGKVDGLVYSAGITSTMPLQQLKPIKIQTVFTVNFFAFIECLRQVTKKSNFNRGMRIVAVSSTASMLGDKAHTAYSASKAAIDASVRCLAKELAEKDIGICSIAPGMTETEMYLDFLNNAGSIGEGKEDILKRQYLGLGQPEDIAMAIAFLLSPASKFITGITLPVDGGATTT